MYKQNLEQYELILKKVQIQVEYQTWEQFLRGSTSEVTTDNKVRSLRNQWSSCIEQSNSF